MRSMRKYRGRGVGLATVTGDYRGVIVDATRDGIELVDVVVVVNRQDVPLAGSVWVPVGQIVHAQVAS